MEVSNAKLVLFLLFVGFSEITGVPGNAGFYWPAAQEDANVIEWSTKQHLVSCGPNTDERTYPPSDYALTANLGYYKFYAIGATWDTAKEICDHDGASLIVVNSDREATAAAELMTAHPVSPGSLNNAHVWTGLHERGEHGKFYTVDNTKMSNVGFWNWNAGEPNDAGLDDAVLFVGNTKTLIDTTSISKYAFICEIELSQMESRKAWFELQRRH